MHFYSIQHKQVISESQQLSKKRMPRAATCHSKDFFCRDQYYSIQFKYTTRSRYRSLSSESPAAFMLSLDTVDSRTLSCIFVVVKHVGCTREIQSEPVFCRCVAGLLETKRYNTQHFQARGSSVIVMRFCFCIREKLSGVSIYVLLLFNMCRPHAPRNVGKAC